ncbi:MAG TPA: hypothetical protein VKV19_08200 [Ktedonobacteraceae bacterium]|nr:hypothetical protein [Ktedonobacteraceae bacterium]
MKIPETYHRGPIDRVLPRFSGGLVPCDQAAITTRWSQLLTDKGCQ